MTRVFVSYRRADSGQVADEIVAALQQRRGITGKRMSVYRDSSSILPGEDFVERLTAEVVSCRRSGRRAGCLLPRCRPNRWAPGCPTQGTLGATYELSADGTYSHLGVTEQRTPGEVYRFEIWEEGATRFDFQGSLG